MFSATMHVYLKRYKNIRKHAFIVLKKNRHFSRFTLLIFVNFHIYVSFFPQPNSSPRLLLLTGTFLPKKKVFFVSVLNYLLD